MSEGRSLRDPIEWDPNDAYRLEPVELEPLLVSEPIEIQATPHIHLDSAFAAAFAVGFAAGVFALVAASLIR